MDLKFKTFVTDNTSNATLDHLKVVNCIIAQKAGLNQHKTPAKPTEKSSGNEKNK